MATASIEDIGAISAGPKVYQLYLLADDALNFASIDRCKDAGFDALCLTVDTIVAGNRERDLRSGLTVPPRLTPASLASFLRRPRSEEHTSELQSLMRSSYAVFCLKKKSTDTQIRQK